MNPAPPLSFTCPMNWESMRGENSARFCDKCQLHVHNVSLLRQPERDALLNQVKDGNICIAYYRRLNGELISPENPLSPSESRRFMQAGKSALIISALALSGCMSLPDEKSSGETSSHCQRNQENIDEFEILAGVPLPPQEPGKAPQE